jgi:hypothetical protein
MKSAGQPAERSFVVFQMDTRRFALPAGDIVELAPPVRLHMFPHTTPLLKGVIVRRGRIVPVYDAAVLGGRGASTHRFFLIARNDARTGSELAAIPVAGECELVSGELQPAPSRPAYVSGTLAIDAPSPNMSPNVSGDTAPNISADMPGDLSAGDAIEVIDLAKLVASIPPSEARP